MLALTALLLTLAATSRAAVTFDCGAWEPLLESTVTATATVAITGDASGIHGTVSVTGLKKGEDVYNGDIIGHVHAAACGDNDAGGHWQLVEGPEEDKVNNKNEVWFEGTVAEGAVELKTVAPVKGNVNQKFMSVVLHAGGEAGMAQPKALCCNLKVVSAECKADSFMALGESKYTATGTAMAKNDVASDPKKSTLDVALTAIQTEGADVADDAAIKVALVDGTCAGQRGTAAVTAEGTVTGAAFTGNAHTDFADGAFQGVRAQDSAVVVTVADMPQLCCDATQHFKEEAVVVTTPDPSAPAAPGTTTPEPVDGATTKKDDGSSASSLVASVAIFGAALVAAL